MLTPTAIASLAELGFYFDAEPCPLSYIVSDIEGAAWAADDDEGRIGDVIADALRIVHDGGWLPVVA